MIGRTAWTIAGVLIGAFFGAGTGIVGAFGGIPGLAVFPILGGVIGFFAAPDISRLKKQFVRPRKDEKY